MKKTQQAEYPIALSTYVEEVLGQRIIQAARENERSIAAEIRRVLRKQYAAAETQASS